ncbi:MAG: S-adenosylmethionine:tRNA ribosyltransferase-isomerase, partial [Bacteroidales bacterium]|nr:S-adenosylmethionine:tRNA ribosyltransferase-isomerase [Bacteroidales bacterium]
MGFLVNLPHNRYILPNTDCPSPERIHLKEFRYHLPRNRIAQYPLDRRDDSRLLVYRAESILPDVFNNLPEYLIPGQLMVFNETRVIRARIHFRKPSGAPVEVFCLEPDRPLPEWGEAFLQNSPVEWKCL